MCRMLSCFHIYHKDCIDGWLVKNASCPVCNKTFKDRKDVKFDFDEEELQQISVDNECFYSDRLMNRRNHILKEQELKNIFVYTLPHEYNFAGSKSLTQSDYQYFIKDYDYQNKNRKDFKNLLPRRRSKSDDEDEFIGYFNIKTKFGI